MNQHRVSYVFFFFAIATTVVAGQSVSIKDRTVTLTCPVKEEENQENQENQEEVIEWKIVNSDKKVEETRYYAISDYNDKKDGLYSCNVKGKKNTHYFYIKAKVCDGCVDLDMNLALVVVFADVLFTLMVVFTVYYCTKKSAGTAGPQRPTQARQVRGPTRGPPPPDPDYQPLNQNTRSADVYATAHRR
ncbi:T-cell surface glycoprotein CD3 epsilon chain-like isoform X2 [Tachysurus vachellii]|uniref:T-cell surface glycoprotein CD3 epsilon chain-like isoform X2 n=1 Tax=Tachysurus vachellii TaxID=175792 RepID=UPI00296AC64E|nr:T-cell surface glycoprotein CD3 epsilon chain-like isoform X2 [Tachysurus vachellii]